MGSDWIDIARVVAPQGTNGELKCLILSDFPDRFHAGLRVRIGNTDDLVTLVESRVSSPFAFLRVPQVLDRSDAERLVGCLVQVPEKDAVALPDGVYFWHQVVGLRVVDVDGRDLGRVTDVLQTGANDVYVVHGRFGEVLIPAIKDVVAQIDVESGLMRVHLPPGLVPNAEPDGKPKGRHRSPAAEMGTS